MISDFLDLPEEGNTWIIIWMVLLLFGYLLWEYLVSLYRKKKSPKAKKFIVCFSYFLAISIEFYIFIQMLSLFPYRKSKFMENVLIPTISFYACLFILIIGIIRSFSIGIFKLSGLRIFKNHRVFVPLLELCYSLAYSVRYAQILSVASGTLTLITNISFPRVKKTKAKRKRA